MRAGVWLGLMAIGVGGSWSGLAHAHGGSTVHDACTDHELWNLSPSLMKTLGPGRFAVFHDSLHGKISAARGFSEAIALRRASGPGAESRIFSEYWLARILYESQLNHAAFGGFLVVSTSNFSAGALPQARGIQLASLGCLNRLREKFPQIIAMGSGAISALEPTSQVLKQWLAETNRAEDRGIIWEFAGREFRSQLREHQTEQQLLRTLEVLKGSGPEDSFARGLLAAKGARHQEVIIQLKKFLAAVAASEIGSAPLARYQDQARLLLVRAYFGAKEFTSALGMARQIRTSSNELAESLSELAWSALSAGQYPEAIGAALSLESGGLRRTFAPEGSMVMAIAMNELCQFPQSLRAIGLFRVDYERPFRFLAGLDHWLASRSFYNAVVDYVRNKKATSGVPERVLSEWTRSPVFISDQNELNSLLDEKSALLKMSRLGSEETKKLAAEILVAKKQNGKSADFRAQVRLYRKMLYAGAAWRTVLASQERNALDLKSRLIGDISRDLGKRSVRMFSQLQKIVDNNQLIEVEIYSGASQDMIWQNAHPDFKELASKMELNRKKVADSKTWNWGTTSVFPEAGPKTVGQEMGAEVGPEIWPEIWEDELASFKADLRDNCTTKDRYLALKSKRSG